MSFFWFLSAVGSVCGALVMLFGYASAKSAPQEAAVAAMAVAAAVVPYVFARAVQLFSQAAREEQRHRELLDAIRIHRPVATPAPAPSQPSGLGASSPEPERVFVR